MGLLIAADQPYTFPILASPRAHAKACLVEEPRACPQTRHCEIRSVLAQRKARHCPQSAAGAEGGATNRLGIAQTALRLVEVEVFGRRPWDFAALAWRRETILAAHSPHTAG
jgi:hypothetical protein